MIPVAGRRGGRRKQLLDHLKETTGYWYLKEGALDRTLWRTRFGRGHGLVWQTTERWRIIQQQNSSQCQTDSQCRPRSTVTVRHFSFQCSRIRSSGNSRFKIKSELHCVQTSSKTLTTVPVADLQLPLVFEAEQLKFFRFPPPFFFFFNLTKYVKLVMQAKFSPKHPPKRWR